MKKNNQHIIPLGNGWAVKKEGSRKFTIITDSKNTAIKVGRQIARNQKSELIIHGKDGKIIDKDSYGNDPCPPKDKNY
ncbi:MAG: DUF2188 domain-containing protein [Ignavibacteria bacterium]